MAVEDHSLYPQWRAALERLIEAKARLDAATPGERELAWADFEEAQGVYFDTAHEV
jgi:hypothetical protein